MTNKQKPSIQQKKVLQLFLIRINTQYLQFTHSQNKIKEEEEEENE